VLPFARIRHDHPPISIRGLEPETITYVLAVESADNQSLEKTIINSINDFVRGCKNDDIWDAIKACCILAGARTLAGALVPLKGPSPTNVSNLFVSGDYNRASGLKGNGSTKYLNTNRNNNADPQNDKHIAVYATAVSTVTDHSYIGMALQNGATHFSVRGDTTRIGSRINSSSGIASTVLNSNGFIAMQRENGTQVFGRGGGTTRPPESLNSSTPASGNLFVFDGINKSNARIAFYSIGEALDLAKLDTRVTALISAFSNL
jgi:hypothetical protein